MANSNYTTAADAFNSTQGRFTAGQPSTTQGRSYAALGETEKDATPRGSYGTGRLSVRDEQVIEAIVNGDSNWAVEQALTGGRLCAEDDVRYLSGVMLANQRAQEELIPLRNEARAMVNEFKSAAKSDTTIDSKEWTGKDMQKRIDDLNATLTEQGWDMSAYGGGPISGKTTKAQLEALCSDIESKSAMSNSRSSYQLSEVTRASQTQQTLLVAVSNHNSKVNSTAQAIAANIKS